jgi:hypothetical protein
VQGKGHDLRRADLRARPVHERQHRRDQRADRLHGGLPDDDGRRAPSSSTAPSASSSPSSSARPASSSSPAATPRPSSPAPSTPTAVSGSSSTSRPSRARTSPPGPASPASAACRCSSCCAPSATTDEAFLERFVRHFDFLEGQWEKERELVPPGRGAARDLQAGPSRRAALARVGPRLLRERLLQPARYDLTRVGRYKLTASSARRSPRSPSSSASTSSAPRGPGRLCPRARSWRLHLHAAPGQRRAGLPPRRPGPLRQPAHPFGRRADPEPGPHRPVPHGARRARAHDDPGRRGHHAADPDQHPAGRGGDQGVLRTSQLSQFMDQHNPLSGLPTSAACRPWPRRPVP